MTSKRKLILANNPLLSGPKLSERENTSSPIPYKEVKLSAIEPDPNQPRKEIDEEKLKELATSISTYGVLNPITLRPSARPGRYIIVAGERRFRASVLSGQETIPAIIRSDAGDGDDTTLALQLVENLQRSDLTSLERAQAIGALKDSYGLSIREVADKLSLSKSMVQRSLEILSLPDDLLNALREGASESKILLLAKITDSDIRSSYLQDLDLLTRDKLQKDLESRSRVTLVNDSNKEEMIPEDRRLAEEIQRSIGLKVKLVRRSPQDESGKLTIEFYSDDDLQEIFRRLITQS
jgi:ParB family transcriptional regulator, chromosome partitioning protein